MFYTYILYSAHLDKYYVGHTGSSLEERLRHHLSSHGGYTSRAKDWNIQYSEKFLTKSEGYIRELAIKKMKSRRYIQSLIRAMK